MVETPPECPGGCGCCWLLDADESECACGGACCCAEWAVLPDGSFRPEYPRESV